MLAQRRIAPRHDHLRSLLCCAATVCSIASAYAGSFASAQTSDAATVASKESAVAGNPDAIALADDFRKSLEQAKLSFLQAEHIAALHEEVLQLLDASIDKPLEATQRDDIAHGISRFIGREMSGRTEEECYLEFRNLMETLKWQLKVTIARGPTTREQLSSRDEQRGWMREFIAARPDQRGVDREQILSGFERLLGDPLNVFTQKPLEDSLFSQFQERLRTANPKLVFATSAIFQSLIDLQLHDFFRKWPVSNSGWSRVNERWALAVNQGPSIPCFSL